MKRPFWAFAARVAVIMAALLAFRYVIPEGEFTISAGDVWSLVVITMCLWGLAVIAIIVNEAKLEGLYETVEGYLVKRVGAHGTALRSAGLLDELPPNPMLIRGTTMDEYLATDEYEYDAEYEPVEPQTEPMPLRRRVEQPSTRPIPIPRPTPPNTEATIMVVPSPKPGRPSPKPRNLRTDTNTEAKALRSGTKRTESYANQQVEAFAAKLERDTNDALARIRAIANGDD